MILHSPFAISPRLCPAIQIGKAWLSYDNGQFVIDLPDGTEHKVTDFHPPRMGRHTLQDSFAALLSFLSACAESRSYGERMKRDAMAGENSDLFPANVGEWAQSVSDELSMLQMEIEESEKELIEDYTAKDLDRDVAQLNLKLEKHNSPLFFVVGGRYNKSAIDLATKEQMAVHCCNSNLILGTPRECIAECHAYIARNLI